MAECIKCGTAYSDRRRQLGYRTCLDCGDTEAAKARLGWAVVPLPKQGYTRVTRRDELKQLNQKPR